MDSRTISFEERFRKRSMRESIFINTWKVNWSWINRQEIKHPSQRKLEPQHRSGWPQVTIYKQASSTQKRNQLPGEEIVVLTRILWMDCPSYTNQCVAEDQWRTIPFSILNHTMRNSLVETMWIIWQKGGGNNAIEGFPVTQMHISTTHIDHLTIVQYSNIIRFHVIFPKLKDLMKVGQGSIKLSFIICFAPKKNEIETNKANKIKTKQQARWNKPNG